MSLCVALLLHASMVAMGWSDPPELPRGAAPASASPDEASISSGGSIPSGSDEAPRPKLDTMHPSDLEVVRARQREATCRYIGERAASDRAQLFSPAVVGSLAMVGFGAATTGDDTLVFRTTARVTLGTRFSASRTRRGVLVGRAADAECRWTRASYDYIETSMAVPDVGLAEESEAAAAFLRGALPTAEAIVEAVRARYEARLATVEELNGANLRRDKIAAALAEAEVEAARQHSSPMKASGRSLAEVRARSQRLERDFERMQGRLRRSQGWDVEIFGGWDLVVGATGRVPAMLGLSATLVPGVFWQRAHDERAAVARAEANRGGRWSTQIENDAAVAALRATASVRRLRLVELETFAAELRARQAALESLRAVDSSVLTSQLELLWYELTEAGAQIVRHRAFVEAVSAFLEEYEPRVDGQR